MWPVGQGWLSGCGSGGTVEIVLRAHSWEWLQWEGGKVTQMLAKGENCATFSEQTRCQNQIPDDARTGQDELNLSGSNWTCPNVVPAKCKEINQGSAPSAPSHHHIVFNLQKPFVESDVKALEAREWKACFVSRRSKVLRLPSYGWSGFNTLLNSLLWCIVGCLMHLWGKKAPRRQLEKSGDMGTVRHTSAEQDFGEVFFLLFPPT